jgi:hypothetical protein
MQSFTQQIYILGELDFEMTLPEVDYEIVVDWEEDTDGIEWTCTLDINGEQRDITDDLSASDYNYIVERIEQEFQNDD